MAPALGAVVDLFKLKTADDITCGSDHEFVSVNVESIVGKCWLPIFYPFLIVFSKALFSGVFKTSDCSVYGEKLEIETLWGKVNLLVNQIFLLYPQCGSLLKCLTRNPGVLGLSHTGSSGFFRGSVLGQDTSEPQPSTGETQERHE